MITDGTDRRMEGCDGSQGGTLARVCPSAVEAASYFPTILVSSCVGGQEAQLCIRVSPPGSFFPHQQDLCA